MQRALCAGGHGLPNAAARSLRRLRAQLARRPLPGLAAAAAAATTTGGCSVLAFAGAGGPLPGAGGNSSSGSGRQQHPPANTRRGGGGGGGGGGLDFGSPLRRVTDALLVLNAAAFAAQWLTHDALTLWGAKVNALVARGQVWRLMTSAFLHSGLLHLAINSHALATIGPHLELLSGSPRLACVYLGSALAGGLASFALTPAPAVGASAALFGLGGALAVFYWRHRDAMGRRSDAVLQQLGLTLAINVVYGLASRRIDNWSHLGGLIGGAALAWVLGPRLSRAADGRVVDQPPVPVLAFASPLAPIPRSRSSSSSGPGKGVGDSISDGKHKGRGLWRRQQQQQQPPPSSPPPPSSKQQDENPRQDLS